MACSADAPMRCDVAPKRDQALKKRVGRRNKHDERRKELPQPLGSLDELGSALDEPGNEQRQRSGVLDEAFISLDERLAERPERFAVHEVGWKCPGAQGAVV